jgi:hypothetical protein
MTRARFAMTQAATGPDASPAPQGAARRDGGPPPAKDRPAQPVVPEIGGPKGPEPTRYGDWEKGGRCTDF